MKNKEDYNWTTNRNYYNKIRKNRLESYGKIRCAYCKYNRGENSSRKWYGGFDINNIRYPSWKMTSKNRKQWLKKSSKYKLNKITMKNYVVRYTHYTITW